MTKSRLSAFLLAVALLVPSMSVKAQYLDLETGVTYTAIDGSAGFGGEGFSNVTDNKVDTKFCTSTIPSWVVIETSTPVYLTGYTISTANDTEGSGRNPKDWTLEGSNDGETWSLIVEVADDDVLEAVNFTPFDFALEANSETFKYFKFTVNSVQDGGILQYSELRLWGVDPDPTPRYTDAVAGVIYKPVAGSKDGNEGYQSSCDGKTNTKFGSGAPNWIEIEASVPVIVTGYTIFTANDNAAYKGRNPKNWVLEGSNDEETWVVIDEVENDTKMKDENYTPFDFEIATPVKEAYKYFKFTVKASQGGGFMQYSEFHLTGVNPVGSYYDAEEGVLYTPIDGNKTGGEGYAAVCDGNVNTKLGKGGVEADPAWFIIEASKPVVVTEYTIYTANDNAAYTGRNPKDWTLEGSNDGNSWTLIEEVTDDQVLQDVNFTPFKFAIKNPVAQAFKYFKFTVSATKSAGAYMQFSELQLKGVEPVSHFEGGHFTYVNGEGNEYVKGSPIILLNGNKQHLNDAEPSAEAGHLLITFDKVLAKGDVLEFEGSTNGEVGLYLVFSNGYTYEKAFTDGVVRIAVTEEMAGSAAVIVTRTDESDDTIVLTKIYKGSANMEVESPWAGAEVGEFIARLYNPVTESYLTQGNAWGTQASRSTYAGLRFELTKQTEGEFAGLYKMVTLNYPNRQFGWDNGSGFYVDINNQADTYFDITPAPGVQKSDRKVYAIKATAVSKDGKNKLEGYLATNLNDTIVSVKGADEFDETCLWQLINDTKRMEFENAIQVAKARANGNVFWQTTDEAAAGYIWTNAQEPSEGPIANLIDGDVNTFFHTAWSVASEDPHYLAVDLGEGIAIKDFTFSYTRRMNNNNNRPTEIAIAGSNDKENWNVIDTLTQVKNALPVEAGDDSYTSGVISADQEYRYLRFTVTHTNNEDRSGSSNSLFFTFSEFAVSAYPPLSDTQKNAILSAAEEAEALLVENPYASDEEFAEAAAALEETVDYVLTTPEVESPWAGEEVRNGGNWVFYNTETKNYLSRDYNKAVYTWNTGAARGETSLRFTLSANEESLYKIVTNEFPTCQLGWDNGSGFYIDITNQANTLYKFEKVTTTDPAQIVYTIWVESVSADGEKTLSGYLCTNGNDIRVDVSEKLNDYCYWQLIDETPRAALEDAIAVVQNKAKEYLTYGEAVALQTDDEAAAGYLWCNAPDQAEGQHPEYMLDGDVNTFFHSDWHGQVTDTHFLQVNLGEGNGLTDFAINYTRRMNNNNNRPTEIVIKGSNDGENWTEVRTLTQAEDNLPTVEGNDSYVSGLISADQAYDYYRFDITKVNNSTIFFTFSEFGICNVTKGAGYDEAMAAIAEAKVVLDNAASTKEELREARTKLLREVFPIADGTYYLYNKENDKFLSRGAAWGTEAALGEFGLPFIVTTTEAGLTSLSALDWQDCRIALVDGTDGGSYVDQTRDGDFVYEYTGGEYIFKNTAAGYLAIEDNENTKALFGLGSHGTDAAALRFKLLTAAEYEAMVASRFDAGKAEAMAAAGIDDFEGIFQSDVTDKVQSASLVDSNEGWTWAPGLYRGGGLTTNADGSEVYQGCGVLSQVVEGLNPGLYRVTLNGFYRINGERIGNIDWYNEGYVMSTAFLAANGNECRIKPVGAEAVVNEAGDNIYPNWMNESKECFDKGMYLNEVFAYVGEDGKLDIAIILPTFNYQCWLMLGGVTLTYYSSEAEAINGEEGTTGINNVAAEVVSRSFYNANGTEIAEPAKGINVVKSVMSDGTIKVEKVLVK